MIRTIETIAIAGAGTMGTSLAEIFAAHSYDVILYDIAPSALERALKSIRQAEYRTIDAHRVGNSESRRSLRASVVDNDEFTSRMVHQPAQEKPEELVVRMSADTADRSSNSMESSNQTPAGDKAAQENSKTLADRITTTTDMEALSRADFLIEAIAENIDIKHTFWERASRIVTRDTLLATNTSGLSISRIAEVVEAPERFAGMHWMNPAHIIPLVELVKGERTADATMDALHQLCVEVGKKPVTVADAPGFVLNRLQLAVLRECLHIVEEGIATPKDVDAVMKHALGLRYACLGPFEIVDQGGIDIFHNIASYLLRDLSCEQESFGLLKECFEEGRLGVKAGRGFYDYPGDTADEAVEQRDRMYDEVVRCLSWRDEG